MAHPLIFTIRRIWSEQKTLRCGVCYKSFAIRYLQRRPDYGPPSQRICCDGCADQIRANWHQQNPPLPLGDLPEYRVIVRPARKPPKVKRRPRNGRV